MINQIPERELQVSYVNVTFSELLRLLHHLFLYNYIQKKGKCICLYLLCFQNLFYSIVLLKVIIQKVYFLAYFRSLTFIFCLCVNLKNYT